MFIEYGVQITTRQNTTDHSIGCISGVLKWATGRNDLGEFKNGIIVNDSISEVSQEIEIARCGSYGTMSAFNLKIDNATNFIDKIRNLGLELAQSEAIVFCFRKDLEEDPWLITQDWTGKVKDWSYDEDEIEISFMDSFRGIHKSILKRAFTFEEFKTIPQNLINEFIPVSIGLVSRNKLFLISQKEDLEYIYSNGNVQFNIAACVDYSVTGSGAYAVTTLTLKTGSVVFSANALSEKQLIPVKGSSESNLIISNLQSSGGNTVLYLSNPFNSTPVFWSETGTVADVWFFQIPKSLSAKFICANHPINSFKLNSKNANSILTFDSALNQFEDVSEIGNIFDTGNLENLNYPGCTIFEKLTNAKGEIFYKKFEQLNEIIKLPEGGSGYSSLSGTGAAIAANSDLPNLHNKDKTISYNWTAQVTSGTGNLILKFKIPLNKEWITSNFKNIFLAFDQRLEFNTVTNFTVYLNVKLLDFLGRTTEVLDAADRVIYASNNSGFYDANDSLIEKKYAFGFTSSIFDNIKAQLALNYQGAENISKLIDIEIYPHAVFEIKYRWTQAIGTSTANITLKEMTLVGEKSLNLLQDNIYTQIKGLPFQNTWGGRKTATAPIQNVAEAIESLFRLFDEVPEIIDTESFDIVGNQTGGILKDFYIGQQFLKDENTADLIDELCRFSFLGIIPKNNGKRALKSWMDESPSVTHSDTNNTIIEKSIGQKVPTSLADVFNLPKVNFNWNPELQKFDSAISIEKIEETAFPAIDEFLIKSEDSLISLSSVNTFVLTLETQNAHNFEIGDLISVVWTGGEVIAAPIIYIASDKIVSLQYDNDGLVSVVSGTVKFLGVRLWKTFAIGYEDAEYNEAKTNWEYCHSSYLKYGMARALESSMSDAKWFPDVEADWGLSAAYSAAKAYMRRLCKWTPFRKDIVPYNLPNTFEHASLELLKRVNFSDSTDRDGAEVVGTIVEKTIVPGLGKDYIKIRLMLDPEI